MSIVNKFIENNKPKIIKSLMGSAEGRSKLAALVSGTEDKKSREYKSARRSIERRTTVKGGKEKRGQTQKSKPYNPRMGDEQLKELGKVALDKNIKLDLPSQLKARVHGEIIVSGDKRTRGINFELDSAEDVRAFVNRSLEDESEGLMYLFENEGIADNTERIDVKDYSVTYN